MLMSLLSDSPSDVIAFIYTTGEICCYIQGDAGQPPCKQLLYLCRRHLDTSKWRRR